MFKLSVVITYYNDDRTIEKCIGSVFAQIQGKDVEIQEVILVDDGSSQPFEQYIPPSNTSINFRVFRKTNGGAASARNYGLERVQRTDFIAFLDADDQWHPDKTMVMVRAMLEHDAKIGGSLSESHKFGYSHISQEVIPISFWEQLKTNRFLTSTAILDVRDVASQELYFPDDNWLADEGDLFLRMLYGKNGILINRVLIDYDSGKAAFGESGVSSKLWGMECGEIRNYYRVYNRGHMAVWLLPPLVIFSLLKYVRRLFITQKNKVLKYES